MKTLRTIFLLTAFALLAFGDSMEIRRPTSESDPGSVPAWANTNCGIGGYLASSAMPNAYDAAGQTTSSTLTTSPTSGSRTKVRLFSTWQTTANSYSALTLNVNAFGAVGSGNVCIAYSTDKGLTYTQIRCGSSAQVTSTINLGATQTLSDLRVGVCVRDVVGDSSSLVVYDIWTSGTLGTPPSVGNGSGSGSTAQPVQFN